MLPAETPGLDYCSSQVPQRGGKCNTTSLTADGKKMKKKQKASLTPKPRQKNPHTRSFGTGKLFCWLTELKPKAIAK